MLTDIIQTITYTIDADALPPYDADTDFSKREAFRHSDVENITDHGYIKDGVFHGDYFGDSPASAAIPTGRAYYELAAHETYLHPDNLWIHDENVVMVGYANGSIEIDHLIYIDLGLFLTEHSDDENILYRFCDNEGNVNAAIAWYRLFEDDEAFQRFMKGIKH